MKKFFQQLGLIFLMMVVGTIIDYIVHESRASFYVEWQYFPAKLIFGTVWGVGSYYVLRYLMRVTSPKTLALGVPVLISAFLQTKYFYQGRNNFFVFLFLVLHFLMFLPAAFYIFQKYRAIFLEPPLAATSVSMRIRWIGFVAGLLLLELAFYLYFTIIENYHRF